MATIKSIEEKARAYDEALVYAKKLLKTIGNATLGNLVLKNEFKNMFPALEESEDERIRKALITYFSDEDESYDGIPYSNIRAWLEKQGEQKSIKEHNACEFCEDRYGCVSPCSMKLIEEEKPTDKIESRQEELTEFEKAVKQVMEEAIECGDTHNLKADADMLLRLVQKPWSEEDEKIYTATIFALAGFMGNEDKLEWLKSIKERVQPKQEWSEEEEKMIQDIINDIAIAQEQVYCKSRCEDEINWLKSLKERYTWKPSGEQMLAINTAINVLGKGTINGKYLIELQEQLKKLREE